MDKRYIKIPRPTEYISPISKEPFKRMNNGVVEDIKPKAHDSYVHEYILSHILFSYKVAGYAGTRAAKDIAKALDYAEDNSLNYYEVEEDTLNMMLQTMKPPSKEDLALGDSITADAAALSTLGAGAGMTNIEAQVFYPHMDAIMNASTNRPEASE